MKKRILVLGCLAALSLFSTGCLFHPVARWRANHPCGPCQTGAHYHPLLHPVLTRRAVLNDGTVSASGPVITNPPCHGCNSGVPGVPVSFVKPGDGIPVTPTGYPAIGYPAIGSPTPLTNGPTVVPSYELPNPMPLPKNNGQ